MKKLSTPSISKRDDIFSFGCIWGLTFAGGSCAVEKEAELKIEFRDIDFSGSSPRRSKTWLEWSVVLFALLNMSTVLRPDSMQKLHLERVNSF